ECKSEVTYLKSMTDCQSRRLAMPELPQSICVYCLGQLKPDEVYSCDQCERENASIETLEEGNDSQTPKAPEL
ncbi:hypothetical protein AB8884_21650, partial [Yersinia enterocolitica]|uniref:hypothetical protein n=1 Tax=Yersinia enterocolitica TaxID=630 RepID=UPI003CFCFFFD